MPIFRFKSVKIYTGQKNLHWRRQWRQWQLWGMGYHSTKSLFSLPKKHCLLQIIWSTLLNDLGQLCGSFQILKLSLHESNANLNFWEKGWTGGSVWLSSKLKSPGMVSTNVDGDFMICSATTDPPAVNKCPLWKFLLNQSTTLKILSLWSFRGQLWFMNS